MIVLRDTLEKVFLRDFVMSISVRLSSELSILETSNFRETSVEALVMPALIDGQE